MALAAPRFSPDDVVYIAASANRGFIESYRVDQVRSVGTRYWYSIRIRPRNEKDQRLTVGDRNDLRKTGYLEFAEEELCTLCEALPLVRTYLENALADIENKIEAHCPEGTEGTG